MGRKRLQESADGRPTVHTVAARAGVSIASASRVLNGVGGSPETVRRVREAAAEVGYVPNAIARSLQSQRTGLVALAVEDIGNPVYVEMMRAIEAVVAGSGRQLLVHATGGRIDNETALLRRLAHRYVDGMIISPIRVTDDHLAALVDSPVPVVVVGQLGADAPVDNVRTDSRHGVALAVDHLVATGRRRIGFVNGPLDTVPGAARDSGFRAALARHGIPLDENLIEVGDFQYVAGRAATERLLARAEPDALVCANDLIAVGALHALLVAGRRVPQDVALVGMDDTELARMMFPQLSSVSLGSTERGRRAAELLLHRMADASLPPCREQVPPSLVVRASSATTPPSPRTETGPARTPTTHPFSEGVTA
ncbi:LacI family DNA-binding transcriptional regulator [Micromonospora sp. WMMD1120]|uniref:LacI family DNA-binding transcriptional regulator n=1 Tax=Micromonospora sp. WMMD1120 TaxID=3016106 RepID=UPI0024172E60|nr:LacI family DNA-binding transcriptional regulator [Micromonospora sp. WMMD1120]MDG4810634.1 LacI family DNA-binding transcriptional regulator [Micromonospora sp. WMMD1120]